jgi:hypothetical protein
MVEYTFFVYDSANKSKSRVDRCASIRPDNQREEPLHQENIVVRDGIEPSTFRFSVGYSLENHRWLEVCLLTEPVLDTSRRAWGDDVLRVVPLVDVLGIIKTLYTARSKKKCDVITVSNSAIGAKLHS